MTQQHPPPASPDPSVSSKYPAAPAIKNVLAFSARRSEIPDGWTVTTLAEVVQPRRARVLPSKLPGSRYIGLEHVEAHTMRILGSAPAAEMKSLAAQFEIGDVLYGRLRPYLNKVVRPAFSGLCSTEFIVFPDNPHFRSAFLQYRLNSSEFMFFASHLDEGDRPRVDFGEVGKFRIWLPPEPEQRRIVAKIEELFSDLDAAVAALERVKANLKRYRAAVLKAAVEGKLTAEWRKKNPATETGEQLLKRILAERRKKWEEDQLKKFAEKGKVSPSGWREKYQEPESPDVAGLAELPRGWCWTSIGQSFVVCVGSTPSRGNPKFWNGDIPWVSSGEIQFCHITATAQHITALGMAEMGATINPVGSVLLGMIGEGRTRGQAAILGISAFTNQNCAAIWVSLTPISSTFVFHWLRSQYEVTRKRGSGNNQPALNKLRVQGIGLPLPSIAEQRQIVAEVERRLSVADAVAVQVDRSLKRAARLRQSILKRAFEGKLVAQNPADEPASVLLERIKAQRAVVPERPATGQKRVGTPALPGRGGHVAQPVARPTQPTRKERKLSRKIWLARATIAAYGVQALADQPTFGRVQLQKFLYLAQAHIGLDLQFEFEKQAAGPFDRDIYTVESNAKKRQWFDFTGERGDATHYHPGVEIKDRLDWAGRMFKTQLPAIDKLIGHLRNMNTDQAELFATIHAVWNELVKDGKPCDEGEIVKGVYAWHESKKRFTPGIIRARIKWMRENGYGAAAPGGEMSKE